VAQTFCKDIFNYISPTLFTSNVTK